MRAELLGDGLFTLTAVRIPQLRQLPGVPLTPHDGAHDRRPGHAVDIRYRTVHPYIHPIQALLHAPQPVPRLRHQDRFVSHQGCPETESTRTTTSPPAAHKAMTPRTPSAPTR